MKSHRLSPAVPKVVQSAAWPALGTTAEILVSRPANLDSACELLGQELDSIDLACSRFRSDSELSHVNRACGQSIEVSELLSAALSAALRAARLTDGAVDPTLGIALKAIGYDRDFGLGQSHPLPLVRDTTEGWRSVRFNSATRSVSIPPGMELDLGATAKALAADRAARRIGDALNCGVLVSLGGDIAVAGPPPSDGWQVQFSDEHSAKLDQHAASVAIRSGGLATSSTTRREWNKGGTRYHHIIDPATGASADVVWRTASVAAGSCVDANIASTAAIVYGERAPGWLSNLGLPSRLVSVSGEITILAGWPAEQPEW